MLFTVAFRLSMYSYNGHSCCKQNGVHSSTNNVGSTSLITVWNVVSLYVAGSVNCGVVAELLLMFMVLLYGEVFLTRECERQSGASWWTERRPNNGKETNYILRQIIDRKSPGDHESWSHYVLRFHRIWIWLSIYFDYCQHRYQYCTPHQSRYRLRNICPGCEQ